MPVDAPRRFCCEGDLAWIGYDGRDAGRDLAAWRRRGPSVISQELIDAIRSEGVAGASLLDIGAGVGAVHVALLAAGAARAIDVDASREYLAVARAEAERRGLAGRIDHRYGDLVELVADLPPVDIVTLDSVICCYPYLPALLRAAVRPGPRLVGLTYPHEAWWMRAAMRLFNAQRALRRHPGRFYIHRRAQIDALMAEAGLVARYRGGTRFWRVVLYGRGMS